MESCRVFLKSVVFFKKESVLMILKINIKINFYNYLFCRQDLKEEKTSNLSKNFMSKFLCPFLKKNNV